MTRRPSPLRGRRPSFDPKQLLPSKTGPAEEDGSLRQRATLRVGIVGAALAFGLLLVAGRAAALMLLPDPRLEQKAQVQFEKSVQIEGRRGDILDRNGVVLATTVDLKSLHADPARIDPADVAPLAAALAPLLGLDAARLEKRLSRRSRRDVLLARDLTPAAARRAREAVSLATAERKSLRGALFTRDQSRRFYPGRHEAASLIGLVGHTGAGMAGIERTLDRTLRGEVHKYLLWRDRKGRRVTPEVVDADGGQTVVLTLDRRIQHIAEQALDRTMAETEAQKAYAVVLDVHTGEILAIANRPTQNPNDTSEYDSARFKNHAALDAIEPGSVFKPFIAAAALEEDMVRPETLVDCEQGRWRVGRKTITDDHPHGKVTVSDVIKFSSNIGAAKLGLKLGPERTLGYLQDFGFSRYTGLDLPGETRGAMRKPGSIKTIELATTSYGYGVTSNAIQLAAAFATLGNGGVRMQPRLVKELRNEDGDVVRAFTPEVDRRVVSEVVARQVVVMMESVIQQGGTATRARVPGYRVGGKTGTAWKHVDGGYSATDRIGSFVGLIPTDAPRLAIAVVVDTPKFAKYGGLVAAPAFAEIGGAAMRVLGIPADPTLMDGGVTDGATTALADRIARRLDAADAAPMTEPELQWSASGALRTPDLTGLSLRDALVTLQGSGLDVQTTGSGRVARQAPAAGAPIAPGQRVEVVLQ